MIDDDDDDEDDDGDGDDAGDGDDDAGGDDDADDDGDDDDDDDDAVTQQIPTSHTPTRWEYVPCIPHACICDSDCCIHDADACIHDADASMMHASVMHVSMILIVVSMMHVSMMHVSMMHVSVMHVSMMPPRKDGGNYQDLGRLAKKLHMRTNIKFFCTEPLICLRQFGTILTISNYLRVYLTLANAHTCISGPVRWRLWASKPSSALLGSDGKRARGRCQPSIAGRGGGRGGAASRRRRPRSEAEEPVATHSQSSRAADPHLKSRSFSQNRPTA